jgi:hypothetical protein
METFKISRNIGSTKGKKVLLEIPRQEVLILFRPPGFVAEMV